MRYVICIIAFLYAGLSVYAAGGQIRHPARRKTAALMLVGGFFLILAGILELSGWGPAWLVTVIGSLLICQAALINGKLSGRVELRNHAVRFLITAFLILGSAFW